MIALALAVGIGTAVLGCVGAPEHAAQAPVAAPSRLAPANPLAVAKMAQGVAAAKEGGRDRAIALLREAIVTDANLWEARYNLGVVFATGGDLASAEEELERAAKIAPDATEVTVALAEVQRRRGEHKAAAETLGAFVTKFPQSVEVRTAYVSALRDSGQVDKAIVQAKELLARKPGDASALAELALCHLAKGERDTAALLAKQALEANPKSGIAERATGLIALGAGDDALAFRSFQKATQEDARDSTARMNMGAVLLRAGAYSKAAEQFSTILRANPDDDDAAVGYAAALRGEGDPQHTQKYDAARATLEKVLARDPHHVSALYNLAVLYGDFLKKPDQAVPLYRRFLADAPADHKARAEAERALTALGASKIAPPAAVPAPPPSASAPAEPLPKPATQAKDEGDE